MECKCGGYAHRTINVVNRREEAQKLTSEKITFLPVQFNRYNCADCGRDYTTISKPTMFEGQPAVIRSALGLLGKFK